MANVLTGRQWKIDTASATALLSSEIKVEQIEFSSYSVDTDTVSIQDKNGRIIWEGNGASDLQTVRSGKIGWVDGLKVPTLTAGKIIVYLV